MSKAQRSEVVGFAVAMAQEFPTVAGLSAMLEELMKLAKRHGRLQEKACNEQVKEGHDAVCEKKITAVCERIGCGVIFSGDPRGCTVKVTVPSGRSDSWGGVGVCVPQ